MEARTAQDLSAENSPSRDQPNDLAAGSCSFIGRTARATRNYSGSNRVGGYSSFPVDIHVVNYGSWELHGANPDIALYDFGFRRNDRFSYIYDMGDYWNHDIRIEAFPDKNSKKIYPICTDGSGICPPEDCGGPDGFLTRRDEVGGYDAWRDLDILSGFASDLLDCRDAGKDMADLDMTDVQFAVDRINAREPFVAGRFSRKQVNDQFRDGLHQRLQHQQIM